MDSIHFISFQRFTIAFIAFIAFIEFIALMLSVLATFLKIGDANGAELALFGGPTILC